MIERNLNILKLCETAIAIIGLAGIIKIVSKPTDCRGKAEWKSSIIVVCLDSQNKILVKSYNGKEYTLPDGAGSMERIWTSEDGKTVVWLNGNPANPEINILNMEDGSEKNLQVYDSSSEFNS